MALAIWIVFNVTVNVSPHSGLFQGPVPEDPVSGGPCGERSECYPLHPLQAGGGHLPQGETPVCYALEVLAWCPRLDTVLAWCPRLDTVLAW